ncbi:MAG TPA: hypothetical protein VEK13_01350 [Thermoplasmata archaeon]|nr:hypothetical protein [Thermoplasmata archaeon]
MLTAADLEINVLEFRQRSFQFERLADFEGTDFAVFSRTETESESQFRPRLVHLKLIVPQAWVVYDEPNDLLALSKDGVTVPVRLTEPVIEVRAERTEFREQGIDWKRSAGPGGSLVYVPEELAARVLTDEGFTVLGIL